MFVEVLDALGGDADGDVIDEIFLATRTRRRLVDGSVDDFAARFSLVTIDRGLIRWDGGIIGTRLVNLHWVPIEIRIGKQSSGPPEIHDGEVEFVVILVDAG